MSNYPCPHVDAKGHRCVGHIDRIEKFRVSLEWTRVEEQGWVQNWYKGTHFHLYCSEKGTHTRSSTLHEQLKVWELPSEVLEQL